MFSELRTKNAYGHWFPAYWFHDEIFGDMLYKIQVIPRRPFEYRDENLRENFVGFSDCMVNRPNQTLRIKPPATLRAHLNKTSVHVIHLVKEIDDINKYKIEQENYFLYDDSNMIETPLSAG